MVWSIYSCYLFGSGSTQVNKKTKRILVGILIAWGVVIFLMSIWILLWPGADELLCGFSADLCPPHARQSLTR